MGKEGGMGGREEYRPRDPGLRVDVAEGEHLQPAAPTRCLQGLQRQDVRGVRGGATHRGTQRGHQGRHAGAVDLTNNHDGRGGWDRVRWDRVR